MEKDDSIYNIIDYLLYVIKVENEMSYKKRIYRTRSLIIFLKAYMLIYCENRSIPRPLKGEIQELMKFIKEDSLKKLNKFLKIKEKNTVPILTGRTFLTFGSTWYSAFPTEHL
jgi:hypothetical protein